MPHEVTTRTATAQEDSRVATEATRRLTLEQAQDHLRHCLFPVAARKLVPAVDGINRILSSDLVAPLDIPSQDRPALDGYAFRAADLPRVASAHLRVVGRAL